MEFNWKSAIGLLAAGALLPILTSAPPAVSAAAQSASGGAATAEVSGSEYQVGPGDVIAISVWKEPDVSTTVLIRPDGKISLPLVNDLAVAGKTPMEIQSLVTEKLSPFIKDPNVTVTVKEINSKKVFVLGQVGRAGVYQIMQPTTVLQILTQAGGLAPFANQKGIYVLRMQNGKQERFPFNYKDVVKGEKMEQNILLQPGDTVVVP
ncbi:MAG TPA: polysaccharide biosynthesis/export family protein [Terriglobia bacterium]|nr:polysaccharide biosynthesis/export family protein [Terriglobia bacterium]